VGSRRVRLELREEETQLAVATFVAFSRPEALLR